MRGKLLGVVLLVMIGMSANAQQDGTYTQYMFTPFSYNPGSVGSDGLAHVFGYGRFHHQGLDSKSRQASAGFNLPFNISKVKNGFGILISDDKFALSKNLTVKGNYAVQLGLDDKGINKLGIGVGFGAINGVFDPSKKSNTTNQANLPSTKADATVFDINAGLFFTSSKLYCGISVAHINQPTLKLDNVTIKMKPTMYVTSGYLLPLGDSKFSFYPSFLVQTEFSSTLLSVSSLFDYNGKVWAGASYRINDAVSGIVGFKLFKSIQIGYSYDYITSKLGEFSSGSHEVFLNYSFSLKRDRTPSSYKSIRFL